jgi:ubiquinone/menaquinone biosynthesis C-methylase UbiE
MACSDRYEHIWNSVPEGAVPAHARLRERFLLEGLRAATAGRGGRPPRALDLGCGEGHFAALLAREGARVVAADVAEEPLRRARERHAGLDTRLVEPQAPLPFADASFELVWAGETIERVADTQAWLSEVRRVLRSGGVLLLSTPGHGPLRMLALALRPRLLDAHFDPRGEHLRFYTRRTLAALLADFGFEAVEVRGAAGLPGARAVLLGRAVRKRF